MQNILIPTLIPVSTYIFFQVPFSVSLYTVYRNIFVLFTYCQQDIQDKYLYWGKNNAEMIYRCRANENPFT